MKIKDLDINGKTFLAPLAGITNLPFRLLLHPAGYSQPLQKIRVCGGLL